ncbi:metal-dependent hydrolase [Niabella hirudinis]|uniref:metal-dependent hydrolase n=1 Tax=Niabella hirudinis TaxID=1285929 RepID=UPI003EC118A7
MKFTFYGQSCFLIEINEKKFLFDPFITGNELAKNIDVHSIEADYILVSHGHGDHTADLIPIARRTGALVISNFEIISWLQQQGIVNVHPMNFGSYDFDFGTLTYMQAQHSSSFSDGSYAGAAGGFILASPHHNFYYSGDTSLMLDMQLVPHYAAIDTAILPIGGNFTMNPRDAVKASDFIGCNNIIGVHFDTFGYIKIDHAAATRLFTEAGKKLLIPEIGRTYTF